MSMFRAGLLAVITACSYSPSTSNGVPADGVQPDGPGNPDTPIVEPRCFGTFNKVCFRPPSDAFALNGSTNTVTTDLMSGCAALTSDSTVTACVIAGSSVRINGTLIGIGGIPLVVVATDGELTVDGLLDVSSRRGENAQRGAGSNPVGGCNGVGIATAAGGGAGGSLRGRGGDGGDGAGNGHGIAAAAIAAPATLRGGCPGALGGNPSSSSAGGEGGGAVWLISTVGITINGTINASGAGGAGGAGDLLGSGDAGGAGGGSGGMIVLDAPTIAVTDSALMMAQGGGGGGSNVDFAPGGAGSHPDPAHPGDPGFGGIGDFALGGNGGVSGDGEQGDTNTGQGGCGGGGGVGFIRAFGNANSDGDVFPSITMN